MGERLKFNPLNGTPKWLEEDYDTSHISQHNKKKSDRSRQYYRRLLLATPKWYSSEHHRKILNVYKERDRRNARGENVRVDHIIPVTSKEVCGLNVPWNYQILTEKENLQKAINIGQINMLISLFYPRIGLILIPIN